jgi:hypothetical protein
MGTDGKKIPFIKYCDCSTHPASLPPPLNKQKEDLPSREVLFIVQFEAGRSGFSPRRFRVLSSDFAVDDFSQSTFRAHHDPFHEQPFTLLRHLEVSFRREPEGHSADED